MLPRSATGYCYSVQAPGCCQERSYQNQRFSGGIRERPSQMLPTQPDLASARLHPGTSARYLPLLIVERERRGPGRQRKRGGASRVHPHTQVDIGGTPPQQHHHPKAPRLRPSGERTATPRLQFIRSLIHLSGFSRTKRRISRSRSSTPFCIPWR